MTGRLLALGLIAFALLFGAGLWYAQVYAYYDRVEDVSTVTVGGLPFVVTDYTGLDGTSSPLKLRGCFTIDPAVLADAPTAPNAVPLSTPGWFDCFNPAVIADALRDGEARAIVAARDDPPGFDRIIAIFPDGRAFMWRQLRE